jgi:hypothetical protein
MDSSANTTARASLAQSWPSVSSMPLAQLTAIIIGTYLLLRLISDFRSETNKIPSISYAPFPLPPSLSRWFGAFHFTRAPLAVLQTGYLQYKHHPGLFRISTLDREVVVVADPQKTAELLAAPDDVISMKPTTEDILQVRYTVGPTVTRHMFHAPLVRTRLTRGIGGVIGMMEEECGRCLDGEVGEPSGRSDGRGDGKV